MTVRQKRFLAMSAAGDAYTHLDLELKISEI